MKVLKKTLVVTFTFIATFDALAQWPLRYVDSKVEFIEPSPFDTVRSPGVLNISFLLTNQGPDSLYSDDIVTWEVFWDLAKGERPRLYRQLGKDIAPGGHIVLFDTIHLNGTYELDNALLTFSIPPACYGQHDDKSSLLYEFYDDRQKDNNPSVRLFHRFKETTTVPESLTTRISDVIVYPNPIAAGVINIQGEFDQIPECVELINAIGQIDMFKTEKVNKNHFRIDLIDLQPGIYWVRFWDGSFIYKKQIIRY